MKSPFKIPDSIPIHEQLLEYLQGRFNRYYETNKDIIDDYLYVKSKLEELGYRVHLQYKLTVSNSNHSGKVINAKLKLPFVTNDNAKSKYPYFNVYIGKLADYKLGLNDPLVKIDAEKKLKEFIDLKYPFNILNFDYQQIIIKY
jgi:hypothetical protein